MYIIDNAAKLVLTAEQTAEIERLRKKPAWIRAATGKAKHKSVLASLKLRFSFAETPFSGSLSSDKAV
ncbi:hypothetical protein ACTHSL_09855 [Neisseria sp. P0008.S010]|uniref:hypothetical protein n=1 Tax=Neisseria sp. P0008.S010 TaxID=3436707 RepID=UPI003F7F9B09